MTHTEQPILEQATQSAIALGVPQAMAQRGTAVAHAAGSQPTRSYHTAAHFEHLIGGASELPPLLQAHGIHAETIAMLQHAYRIVGRDHDVVYLGADNQTIAPHILDAQHDGAMPTTSLEEMPAYITQVREILARNYAYATSQNPSKKPYNIMGIGKYLKPELHNVPENAFAHSFCITGHNEAKQLSPEQQKNLTIALAAFGKQYGDPLYPLDGGQNEFLSCLHSLEVNPGIPLHAKVAIAAIHQATIPFQAPDSIEALIRRVGGIMIDGNPALTKEAAHAIGLAAAHFANRDAGSFKDSKQQFEQESIQLMQESRADFHGHLSNRQRIERRLGFLETVLTNKDRAIFRNYAYRDETGTARALYSEPEMKAFGETAQHRIQGEIARLKAMDKIAVQYEKQGKEATLTDIAAAGRARKDKKPKPLWFEELHAVTYHPPQINFASIEFTPRESDVFDLLVQGLDMTEIAGRLHIKQETTQEHCHQIRDKAFHEVPMDKNIRPERKLTQALIEAGTMPLPDDKRTEELITAYRALAPREREVFTQSALGYTNEWIANQNGSQASTVRWHQLKVKNTLKVSSSTELICAWVALKRKADEIALAREEYAKRSLPTAPEAGPEQAPLERAPTASTALSFVERFAQPETAPWAAGFAARLHNKDPRGATRYP